MENQSTAIPTGNAIRTVITKGPITIDSVGINNPEYQKEGFESAQLRQVIKTVSFYPAKKVTSSLSDNLFSNEELGIAEQEFLSEENRVTWMDVAIGTKAETILDRIKTKYPNANLYRILSNKPILSDNQEYAIEKGLKTMDDFANSQAIRYPNGVIKNIGGVDTDVSGALVLDKNKVQYRRVFLSTAGKEDIDLRTEDANDMYLSAELIEELGGASAVNAMQTI